MHTKTAERLQKIQMGKRQRISENERHRVIGMLNAGLRQQDVVRQFNVHPSTIGRLLRRFRITWQESARQRLIDVN